MHWPALFLGCCLLFLGFAIAITLDWWGLLIAAPLSAFALALLDRSRNSR